MHIALMQLGERFLMMGDPAVAAPVLERAPQIRPGYAPAERALAEAQRLLSAGPGEKAVASEKAATGRGRTAANLARRSWLALWGGRLGTGGSEWTRKCVRPGCRIC